ncbi:patatin [Owenweeksia hongkongensis]|uniref:patatin n=1 Tax=Owenweeksia hongkongensis TaxID=253245 RepID=UPI003A93A8D5
MKKFINLIVVVISVLTVVSGLTQVVMPGFVLNVIGAEVTDISKHLFGIVGMFMALFGSLMLHTVYQTYTSRTAVFWCAMQKLGAFAAVSLGVYNELFSWMALGVAIFDLISGILFLYYIKTLKENVN